jgi:undecaprenyl-diphosphatase
MDYSLFKDINGLSGSSFFDGLFKFLANDMAAVLVILVALIFLLPWNRRRAARRSGAVLGTAASGLGLLINQPIAHAIDRVRPFIAHPGHAHLLIARSTDPSFPSDHATGAFGLAFGIWLYDRTLGSVLLGLAALVSFARVYVGTHYPGDVVAGALIAMTVGGLIFVIPATRRLIEGTAAWIGSLWDRALPNVTRRTARSR